MKDGDPAALSLYGMLRLRSTVAAGRQQDQGIARELLAKAETAGDALGEDANPWLTGFGPTPTSPCTGSPPGSTSATAVR